MTPLAELLSTFDSTLPLARAHTIPRSWYVDPRIDELERQAVFGSTWQVVARSSQLSEPGSFVTATVGNEPILVVRDDEGTLRAFYNVCRHRAALVMTGPCGRADRLRCRYHGWTYDLAGQLRGVPEFAGVEDFCHQDYGLVPLAVSEAAHHIWVHAGSATPLDEMLQGFTDRTADCRLEAMKFVERREYDLYCNWKVFVDNYLDGGYHIPSVHPGLGSILDYSEYHTVIHGTTSVQLAPLSPPRSEEGQAVAGVRTGEQAQYWWIYPNFMINIADGVMDTNLVVPVAPDRCKVIFDFYFENVDSPSAKTFIEESIAVSESIQQEDIAISEEVQRGLSSRSFETGRFSVKREEPGYHFHQLLGRQLQNAIL